MQRCFICNGSVLGLVGQDELLDSVYLTDADSELIANEIFGECHSTCLQGSPWVHRWSNLRVNALLEIRGYIELKTHEARVCLNPKAQIALVELTHSHKCVSISTNMLDLSTLKDKNIFVEHEVNWNLGEQVKMFIPLLETGAVSMGSIIELLGIREKYSELVVSQGWLQQTPDTREYIESGYLSGSCRYPLDVPSSVRDLLADRFAKVK